MISSNDRKQHYGITPPISLKAPSAIELKATEALIDVLAKSYGQYETNEEAQKR